MTATVVPSGQVSTLGYRTFLTIAGDRSSVPQLVDEQIHSWFTDKGWAGDFLHTGREVRLSPEATGTRTDVVGADGTRTMRLRTTQAGGWITQLTVHLPSSRQREAWLWMDVLAPGGLRPGPPNLIRNLVGVLDTRDGDFQMPAGPVTVDESGVDDLVARLIDPGRRTIAFVAGSGGGVPFGGWAGHVGKIVRNNHGLASTHVLTPGATAMFRTQVGASHAVAPFTVRTFLPRVDITEPDDGVRHRFLTMQRITEAKPGVLANVLKGRAVAYSLALSLPKETIRVDRLLRGRDTAVLLDSLTVQTAPAVELIAEPDVVELPLAETVFEPPPAIAAASAPAPEVVVSEAAISTDTPVGESTIFALLQSAIPGLVGGRSVDEDAVRRLIELAVLGQRAALSRAAIEVQITDLQDQLVDAEVALLEFQEDMAQVTLEQAISELDLLRSEDLVRRLRLRIGASTSPGDAWADQPASDAELVPQDFTDLLGQLAGLDRIRFTGDPSISQSLDEHGFISWAAKAWTALKAVQDYATCRLDGRWNGDLEAYLTSTPAGCVSFPANRFARDETATLKSSSKLCQPRMLPVPSSVASNEVIFMGAHFKIAQWRTVSPRMHLHDDVTGSGLIYVGYIGPHLPGTRSIT